MSFDVDPGGHYLGIGDQVRPAYCILDRKVILPQNGDISLFNLQAENTDMERNVLGAETLTENVPLLKFHAHGGKPNATIALIFGQQRISCQTHLHRQTQ